MLKIASYFVTATQVSVTHPGREMAWCLIELAGFSKPWFPALIFGSLQPSITRACDDLTPSFVHHEEMTTNAGEHVGKGSHMYSW